MTNLAYAMGQAGGGGAADGGGGVHFIIMMVAIFAIFYFLLIRPQQKKAKQHKQVLGSLKKGDRVVSSGGLHGVITGLSDDVVTMEISPKVRVKVTRGSIAGVTTSRTETQG